MLKTLCSSHGRVKSFSARLDQGEATVTYSVHADAVRAQRALDMCLLGDCHMVAELVSGGVGGDVSAGDAVSRSLYDPYLRPQSFHVL